MRVVVSSTSNGDLAEQAILGVGTEPVFACLHGPREHSINAPVSYYTDEADYTAWLRRFFSEDSERNLFFSTAASDHMQLGDMRMKEIVIESGGEVCRSVGSRCYTDE